MTTTAVPESSDRSSKIVERLSDDIDVVVSGHTHRAYNCTIDGKLVTSAAAFGRVISAIELTIDKRSADVVAKSARNVIVTRDVAKDPAQTAIIERYRPFYTTRGEQGDRHHRRRSLPCSECSR